MVSISQDLKKRLSRKFGSIGLTGVLVFSTVFSGNTDWIAVRKVIAKETTYKVETESSQVDAKYKGKELADNVADGVILHAWNWSFSQIKEEIPKIAEAGFTAVQTSPIQPNKDGNDVPNTGAWWKFYQPTNFAIGNKLGSESEFKAMCDEAHKYGVKVVVDVVANHLANVTGQGGNDASDRSPQIPDNIRNNNDFWHNDKYSGSSDGDRYQMTRGPIGMPDLNTSNEGLQNIITGFLSQAQSNGADGFRFDAAKHIETPGDQGFGSQFWAKVQSVTKGNDPDVFLYGEILNTAGPGGYNDMKKYTPYIRVTNNLYGHTIQNSVRDWNASYGVTLHGYNEKGEDIFGKNGEEWVLWNESHDTFAGEYGDKTDKYSDDQMLMAWCAVAARYPAALYFARPTSMAAPIGEHKMTYTDKRIAEMNKFHNNFAGQTEYASSSENVLVVERGTTGVALINYGKGSKSVNIKMNKMADGTYIDQVSGKEFKVSGGTLTGQIEDGGVAAIYNKDNSEGDITQTTKPTKTITPGDDTPTSVKANTIVATKPSGWGDLYIYAYQPGATATKLTGEWPGTKMTAGADGKYTYTMDASVKSAKVIFAEGASGNQDPKDTVGESCGFDYVGGKAYSYDGGSWSELSISKATEKPEKTQTPEKTKTPSKTDKPKETETPEETDIPTSDIDIKVNKIDGTSFSEETMDVKITLSGATSGTYSVDDGPEKTFKSGDAVTIGQGKIADSTITLEVSAGTGSKKVTKAFEYEKVFDPETAVVKSSAISRIRSLFEVAADAVEVNAAPGSSHYATNPNGNVGTKKTISSASDFTEDMIIAQGVANDDPGTFRGTHEAPKFDPYAMYGAWDDENLYIGIQYTNVIDVVDPAQQAPQTGRGKPNGADADIPQMLVFDTRSGDYTDGTTNDTKQKTAWDTNVKFGGDAKVDKVFLYSPKDGIINQAFFPVKDGVVDYDNVTKSGYNMPPIPGVETIWEDGFFGTSMYGIKGTGYTGYTPADLDSDSGNWVDFLSEGHSKEQDTFCIVKLPLSLLGVTASDIESNGIGVMAIATYGSSGIGSLPADMTMLDVASEAYSKDDSTSAEKEDEDLVTVGLAQLGKSGGSDNPATKKPAATEKPKDTEIPKDTETPKKTDKPAESTKYTVNFGADYSSPQFDSRKLILKAIPYNGEEDYTYEFFVDGEVVQAASSKETYSWKGSAGEHSIKVVVKDKSGKKITSEKQYVIESASGNNTQETQKPEETTKPSETKKPDNTKSPEKTDAPKKTDEPRKTTAPEQTDIPRPTQNISTEKPSTQPTQKPSVTPTPTGNNGSQGGNNETENKKDSNIVIRLTKKEPNVVSSVAGKRIVFYMSASGGSGNLTYKFEIINSSKRKVRMAVKNSSIQAYEKQVTWTPAKMGTYKICVTVTDENGNYNTRNVSYKITTPIKVKTFKASKNTVKKNKKIKFTVKATSISGVKYRFKLQKIGSKTIKTLRGYSNKRTYTWKANKKGKYYVYLEIKDSDGNTKQVKKKITVK